MKRRVLLGVVVLLLLQLVPTSGMGGRIRQFSKDTAWTFVGMVMHGPRVGTVDYHVDLFGGANWNNETALQISGPPYSFVDKAILASQMGTGFWHSQPPCDERIHVMFAFDNIIHAPTHISTLMWDTDHRSAPHESHFDDLDSILVGWSDKGRISGALGIVLAQHSLPGAWLVFSDYGRLTEDAKSTEEAAGLAALTVNEGSRSALLAVGLLGTEYGTVEGVSVRAGTVQKPGPVVVELSGHELPPASDLGFGGVFERSLGAEQIEAVEKAGAHAVVKTTTVTLQAQLDGFETEEDEGRATPAVEAEALPAPEEPAAGQLGAVWDLGTQQAGKTFPTSVTVVNRSCPGKRDFEISVEGEAVWFLSVTGPTRLENIKRGKSRASEALLDLREVEPGTYDDGTLVIRCLDCPPSCVQDHEVLRVHLTVVETPPPQERPIPRHH